MLLSDEQVIRLLRGIAKWGQLTDEARQALEIAIRRFSVCALCGREMPDADE